eukprot:5504706-Amphidinium_carterae.2
MERLQALGQVTAITGDSQITLMAEARRLMIMGSSVEDTISKAAAQTLVDSEPGSATSPRGPAVRLTPKAGSARTAIDSEAGDASTSNHNAQGKGDIQDSNRD